MSLASNAIITLDDYKEIVGVSTTNTNVDDTKLEWHINAASQAIEDYCHRGIVSPSSAVTETFAGTASSYYYVKHRHIASSTTPALYYWSNNDWQTVDSSSWPWTYDADNEKGRVFFTDGETFWEPTDGEYENWKLTYVYGWAIADVPQDIKMACAHLVTRKIRAIDKAGTASEGFGDSQTNYNLEPMNIAVMGAIPRDIEMVLARYKRFVI